MNNMRKFLQITVSFVAALLMAPGFIQAAASSSAAAGKASAPKAVTAADWQQKWESTLAKAKQEGIASVMVIGWPTALRPLLIEAFYKKYGINLEYSPVGRGAEMTAKVFAEQKAGIYNYDFFGTGSTTAMGMMKPQGLIGPIEPHFILPEVSDPSYWRAGKLPFVDRDRFFFGMAASKQPYIVYNRDLIKSGEITSYADLLKPQYAGKISLNDPSTSGSGNAMITHLAVDIWNEQKAKDFLRQLLAQQKAVIERDNRVNIEAVARGKYAITLGADPDALATFLQTGAPIVAVVMKDVNVTCAAGGAAVPSKMAHPNAGVIFLNWLLSREGQSVFAKGWGTPSSRLDATAEGVNPLFHFQAGETLYFPTEEKVLAAAEWMKISKQIIDEVNKK